MPQLSPYPWFTILLSSWVVLLAIVLPKTLAHTTPNEPASQAIQTPKAVSWAWFWS